MFNHTSFGFITISPPYELLTMEQLNNLKPDIWVDSIMNKPLVYRMSEELEYNQDNLNDILTTEALKLCHLVLYWLQRNYQNNAILVWKVEQQRYSIKIGCGAYAG